MASPTTQRSVTMEQCIDNCTNCHRICLEITSLDLPTGVAGATNAEYVPYHICSSKTVVHRIHRDEQHPSHLVLPIIPLG